MHALVSSGAHALVLLRFVIRSMKKKANSSCSYVIPCLLGGFPLHTVLLCNFVIFQ